MFSHLSGNKLKTSHIFHCPSNLFARPHNLWTKSTCHFSNDLFVKIFLFMKRTWNDFFFVCPLPPLAVLSNLFFLAPRKREIVFSAWHLKMKNLLNINNFPLEVIWCCFFYGEGKMSWTIPTNIFSQQVFLK